MKHAAAYDLENWGGFDRDSFNAIVSDQDLVQYYWPAWRAAIEGADAASVMCSYNAVNGVPSCVRMTPVPPFSTSFYTSTNMKHDEWMLSLASIVSLTSSFFLFFSLLSFYF